MSRDLRLTFSDSQMISVPTQVSIRSLEEYRTEWGWNGYDLKLDISIMIPVNSIYSKESIEYGLYALNDFLQRKLGEILRWEFIINLFSKLDQHIQYEIVMFGTHFDKNNEKKILNDASKLLVNMPWASSEMDGDIVLEWKSKIKQAVSECKHPRKYGVET